jgi:hypothetical protein
MHHEDLPAEMNAFVIASCCASYCTLTCAVSEDKVGFPVLSCCQAAFDSAQQQSCKEVQ